MRIALLKGNRFNPWHLQVFKRLRGQPAITAFRAESEIQQHFHSCDDGSLPFTFERIFFDTQIGNPFVRLKNTLLYRYRNREPRLVAFHERLRDFDVIHSWELFTDWSAEAVTAREKFGIPLAVMVWDNIPFNMERNPVRRELKRRVAAAADVFLVHTERSRRTLGIEGVDLDRVVQLDVGVDLEVFCPGERNRTALGVSEDEFLILFVGWFLPRKGLDFLILAIRELLSEPSRKNQKVRLLIVGTGPGRERIEQLIERLGMKAMCTFTGSVPYNRMPEIYRAADVFVLPSIAMPDWQEQFGMSLIEAMACGTPVITTWSGAIPEIVGDAAVLCQPNDFLALYEALKTLIAEPGRRNELGARGRARAQERFDLNRSAAALSDVYDHLLTRV